MLAFLILFAHVGAFGQGERSDWNGFEQTRFKIAERDCLIVSPKQSAEGNPWIWRMEFFGHEPQADIALLHRGWHVVYMDVQNQYGGPKAMEWMDRFYEHLTCHKDLSEKVVLEGFSRGGLFSLNWAARNPSRVAAIYNDAPVCDFCSWPGGKGKGPGSASDWQRCLEVYGISEETAVASKLNPINNLEPIAKAKIPLLHVCGDADEVVPLDENTLLLAERYRALGGNIEIILKKGVKHHPHSLVDPTPIVNFALRAMQTTTND